MMHSLGSLTNLNPNMRRLLAEETYLDINDPELFAKLARYLRPEKDNDANENDELQE